MGVCVSIHIYIYIYIYVYIHTYIHTHIYIEIYIHHYNIHCLDIHIIGVTICSYIFVIGYFVEQLGLKKDYFYENCILL